MFKFGVDSLIWTEEFTEKDLPLIGKAKALGFDVIDINISHPERFPTQAVKSMIKEVGIEAVTTFGLSDDANVILPDPKIRKKGVETIKKVVDINNELGSKILGGVFYATWGYLSGKPRTEDEWKWSVECMREAALYAKNQSGLVLGMEVLNRFESHFLNVAEDAVKYCKEVGTGNVKVHLDTFHMIREETSFREAVEVCGKEYLGYVHVCENNRGIPGTGLVPWKEFFTALKKTGYGGPLTIESFDPGFTELNRLCCIWRKFAETGEELAVKGLKNLKNIEGGLDRHNLN
jgi:D-psicose/D-tagatose/L-ribulose 3-epimerase